MLFRSKTVKCKSDRAGQGRGEAKGLDENEIADVLEIWIVSQGDQTADESTARADRSHLLLTYLHYPSWISAPDKTWHKESLVFSWLGQYTMICTLTSLVL